MDNNYLKVWLLLIVGFAIGVGTFLVLSGF
jgi:hypothetical protein